MESLKIYNICESLLFGKTKITLSTFLKKCKKQNIKVIRGVAERIVAFLQSLPKNLALFQALKPTFKYILQDQFDFDKEDKFKLSEEDLQHVLKIEKLEFKNHVMRYELIAALYIMEYYENLFTESFIKFIERKNKKAEKYLDVNSFSSLENYLARKWLEYGDKKNFTYELDVDIKKYCKSLEIAYIERQTIVSSKTFENFSDMALNLFSLGIYIYKVNFSSEIYCE